MRVATTVVSWIFFLLSIAAWVIFLGGTGASHRACIDIQNSQPAPTNVRKLQTHGRELMSYSDDYCYNQMALPWWVVWFQAVCIVFAMLVAASGFMSRFSSTAVLLYVSVTTIMMYNASQANNAIFTNKDGSGSDVEKYVAGMRAALAAMVFLMVLNFIYIFCNTEDSRGLAFYLGCGMPRRSKAAPADAELSPGHKMTSQSPITPAYVNHSAQV